MTKTDDVSRANELMKRYNTTSLYELIRILHEKVENKSTYGSHLKPISK